MMKHRTVRLVILLGVITTIGAAVWFLATGGIPEQKVPKFLKAYLGDASSSSILELQGNVEIREVRLGFEVPGRIADMLVDEGDKVSPGQVLAEIKPDYFKDAVRQAEAALEARKAELLKLGNGSRPEEIKQAGANTLAARVVFLNAQKEFLRAQNLVSNGALSQKVFDNAKAARDQAEAKLQAAEATQKLVELGPRDEDIARARALAEQAQAKLDEAQRRLADSKLVAPTGGIIQTKVREPGGYVHVGEPIYTISIMNPVWVRTYVNEIDLGYIRPGMQAIVHTDTGKSYPGRVGFISPVAEFTPKTVQTREIRTDLVYRIRVIVPDPKGELRQGMPVSVTLDLSSRDER